MSDVINYRLEALQMTRRLMLTNILPQGPPLIISYSLQILFYPPAACDPIRPTPTYTTPTPPTTTTRTSFFFSSPFFRFVIIHNLVPGHI